MTPKLKECLHLLIVMIIKNSVTTEVTLKKVCKIFYSKVMEQCNINIEYDICIPLIIYFILLF